MLALHEGKAWRIVQEHLHDTIGKQLVGLDAVQAALPHFLAEVDCPFNSKEWQLYYLDQYVEHVALLQRQQVCPLRWLGMALMARGSLSLGFPEAHAKRCPRWEIWDWLRCQDHGPGCGGLA